MKSEIKKYLIPDVDDKNSARISFPKSFTGFQGHFPDTPILPGVCIIQTAEIMIENATGQSAGEVLNAKFFSTAFPDTLLDIVLKSKPRAIEALVRNGEQKVALIKFGVNDA